MLAKFTIQRWQLTLILFALLTIMGLNSLFSISRAVDPHFPIPVTVIIATLPGADALEMEELVAKPIEDAVQGIDDLVEIRSTSRDGATIFSFEFLKWSGDVDDYFDEVVREVSAVRSQLPDNLQRLEFQKVRTTQAAVVQLALVSEKASWRRMEKYAEDVADEINQLREVANVTIHALAVPEISVALDSRKLAELRLSPRLVAQTIRAAGTETPVGAIESGDRRYNVDVGGAFRTIESIEQVPIRINDGSLINVADIAEVKWGHAEQLYRARHNGKRAVFIAVEQKNGADVIRLKEKIDAVTAKMQGNLPPDLALIEQFDQSKVVRHKLNELTRDFLIAISLVLITLIPLGVRASLIVMISIPLSLSLGLLSLHVLGFNLSQLSIAGFIVSLGLLVDDSIVVTENIARHLRMGKSRTQAAIDASREIRNAVIGSTLVLIFAFAPLLFMPGGAGAYTKSFFLSIILTVLASLLIALSLIPFLASRLLKRDENPEGNAALRFVDRHIQNIYRPILSWSLFRPWRTFWAAMILCFSAFALVPSMGFSLFPYAETPYFRVVVESAQGSSFAYTDQKVREVAEILREEPLVEVVAENIGNGNPQVFYNVRQGAGGPNQGEILTVLSRWRPAEGEALIERLRTKFDKVVGASVTARLFFNGAPVAAPVQVRVFGPELSILKTIASDVAKIIRDVPGTRDIENPLSTDRLDLDIDIDENQAALLNIASGEARRTIRLALTGEESARFRDEEGDVYPVMVRLPQAGAHSIDILNDIYVTNRDEAHIQLDRISMPKFIAVPTNIERYQKQRHVSVIAQLQYGAAVSLVADELVNRLDAYDFPSGYSYNIGGESEAIGNVFGDFGVVVLTALILIFAVLVAEFGRFRETIVVAGVIPLGTFGGLIALWITGNSLSFMAIIGFIALIGIEIKNSILLVDFTTQLRHEGLGLREAIEKAGEVRFLPVLLTSLTAIGGLMPLAILGGSLYGPVAVIIIGGLISSTLLSRIVTPVMYWLVARAEMKSGEGG